MHVCNHCVTEMMDSHLQNMDVYGVFLSTAAMCPSPLLGWK